MIATGKRVLRQGYQVFPTDGDRHLRNYPMPLEYQLWFSTVFVPYLPYGMGVLIGLRNRAPQAMRLRKCQVVTGFSA